jgi:hypothetical protein
MNRDHDRVDTEIARAVRAGLADPSPGFRQRLLDALRTPPPPRPGQAGGRLLATASFALGLLIVGGLLVASPSARARIQSALPHGTSPAGQPAPSASPSATAPAADSFAYRAVTVTQTPSPTFPNGRTVESGPLLRADWSGATVAPIVTAGGVPAGVKVSPDGRYAVVPDPRDVAAPGGPHFTRVIDASGSVVASGPGTFDLWAVDSRHLCSDDLAPDGHTQDIRTAAIGPAGALTTTSVPVTGPPAATSAFLQTCDLARDRGLLLTESLQNTTVYDVQLSTGRVVDTPLALGSRLIDSIATDGRVLAARGAGGDDVIDTATGAVLRHLNGTVVGFSGDDQLAVETGAAGVSVVELATGRVVWSDPAGQAEPGGVRSQVGGRAIAITVRNDVVPDVMLVRADGSAVTVAHQATIETLGLIGGVG